MKTMTRRALRCLAEARDHERVARSGAATRVVHTIDGARHASAIQRTLGSRELMEAFATGSSLPPGFGYGLSERIVEYPWLLSRGPEGSLLDAGSVLNHAYVLGPFQRACDDITIVTLAPEKRAFTSRGVSYLYRDLRDLPFRDGAFDTVICCSTLEHIGMDNRVYGAADQPSEHPRAEARRAVAELLRVLKPSGRLLITAPYGAPASLGWLRQLGGDDLSDIRGEARGRQVAETVFRYERGWQLSDLASASASQFHGSAPPNGTAPEDLPVAAGAVVCIEVLGAL